MKVISLDCETNGLGGQAFAAAAVFTDDEGRDLDVWQARCPIDGDVDPWVAANVLPALTGMLTNADDYFDLLGRWGSRWRHWRACFADAVMVVHVPWPVEAKFLRDVHTDDLFAGPYPLIDVAPMLLVAGHDPTSVDAYLAAHDLPKPDGSPHHPLYDARAAERAFRHLMATRDQSGREAAARDIETADTSGWPGGRGSDVDGCQERAAAIARVGAR